MVRVRHSGSPYFVIVEFVGDYFVAVRFAADRSEVWTLFSTRYTDRESSFAPIPNDPLWQWAIDAIEKRSGKPVHPHVTMTVPVVEK